MKLIDLASESFMCVKKIKRIKQENIRKNQQFGHVCRQSLTKRTVLLKLGNNKYKYCKHDQLNKLYKLTF